MGTGSLMGMCCSLGNFARVAGILAGAEAEMWADILHSRGFTEAVAQDDPEQVQEALGGVSWNLWAGILDSPGACEAIVWRNLPELAALLRKQSVSEQYWWSVLDISAPELYNAVFNGELASQSRRGSRDLGLGLPPPMPRKKRSSIFEAHAWN